MLAHAQANNPTARFLQMDARDLHKLAGPYDAVVCGFVLPYLARPAFENLLQEAVRLLSPHGLLYLSTIEGNYAQSGYESGSDKSIQMYVYYYSEAEIEAALQHHGFAVRSCTKLPYTTSKGKATTHLVFLASRS
jgi:2-polyprenyl-3-methyl-5-hydroxy-6-metoxy-1,4-benzoquinol methylase